MAEGGAVRVGAGTKLRVLRRLTAINVQMTLEYRGTFFLYMFGNMAVPVVSLLVWLSATDAQGGTGAALPLDRSELVTYFVLLGVVAMLTSSWLTEWVGQEIRLGGISPWLLRPAPYVLGQVANNVAEKLVKLLFLLPLVALLALAFREDLRLPSEPLRWALFALCLPMGGGVVFLLDMLVASLAFWLDDINGLHRVRTLVAAFLSGQVVPLALFPEWLGDFMRAQPFRYTVSFPLEILTADLSRSELAWGFALQVGYLALFWQLYRVVWRRGLRAYGAVGA